MDREEALKIVRENYPHFGTTEPWLDLEKALATLIPELRESEDEITRKHLINLIRELASATLPIMTGGYFIDGQDKRYIAYLEKQKENPKSADSIPSKCVSDAKCEDRWHKTFNSLPDDGRDVLAKDALGNYLLASFDGAQWFVSVYDGEDHPVLHTPPILEWCDLPSEIQKEQKPAEWDELQAEFRSINEAFEDGKKEVIAKPERYGLCKPAEWSEEDKAHIESLLKRLDGMCKKGATFTQTRFAVSEDMDWLKSLSLRSIVKPKQEWSEK